MNDQHRFTIEVETIQPGDYGAAFTGALELADNIIDNTLEPLRVIVREGDRGGEESSRFSGSDAGQAFCEGCEMHTIPGVRWPTACNDDNTREWVERCDTCNRYEDDEEAADRVVETYEGSGATIERGLAAPAGKENEQPYVNVN